jgi:hypothetical protein
MIPHLSYRERERERERGREGGREVEVRFMKPCDRSS